MKYCEDCKWLAEYGECARIVDTPVRRQTALWIPAKEERRSGAEDACGPAGKYWEEYIPPQGFWEKFRHALRHGGA